MQPKNVIHIIPKKEPARLPLNMKHIGLIHRRQNLKDALALETCPTYRYSEKNTFRGRKIIKSKKSTI